MIKDDTVEVVHTGFETGLRGRSFVGTPTDTTPTIDDLKEAARWTCQMRGEDPDLAAQYRVDRARGASGYACHGGGHVF